VHQLASWWLISIRADLSSFFLAFDFIVLPLWGFFFEGLQSFTYLPRPRFQQHFHLLIALHTFRAFACVLACAQVEIGLY